MEADQNLVPDLLREFRDRRAFLIATDFILAAIGFHRLAPDIPIVLYGAIDFVSVGLAENLPHPGRNVTGVYTMGSDLVGKTLSMLHEIAPSISRIGCLYADFVPTFVMGSITDRTKSFAASAGLGIEMLPYAHAGEVAATLARVEAGPDLGLYVARDPISTTREGWRLIGEATLRLRVPAVGPTPVIRVGGLLSLSSSDDELLPMFVMVIDKVLRGADAGDVPIIQPSLYKVIVNKRVAAAFGLTIPNTVLIQADEVIE